MKRLLTLGLLIGCGSPARPVPEVHHHNDAEKPVHQSDHEGDHHAPLVHGFDSEDAEHWVKRFEGPKRDATQKPSEVVAAMNITSEMVVADIGAGTGYFLPHLSKAAGRVLALDIAPNMVRHMKKRAASEGLSNVEPRLVLTDDPLLANNSVDRILIVNTWHHIDARAAYVEKLALALKPGGSVWVVDFTQETTHGPSKKHRVEPAVVAKELGDGGLRTELNTELLTDQYIVIGTSEATP
jgi:cyclopropane fatty-acyl-phospholipid synthase-like methyltransferase